MAARKTTTKPVKVQEIDADTWAESGGTAGMFGKLWKQGRLKIVPSPEDGSQIRSESLVTVLAQSLEECQERIVNTMMRLLSDKLDPATLENLVSGVNGQLVRANQLGLKDGIDISDEKVVELHARLAEADKLIAMFDADLVEKFRDLIWQTEN